MTCGKPGMLDARRPSCDRDLTRRADAGHLTNPGPVTRLTPLMERTVTASPTCPRCGGRLRPPSLWSSEWLCDRDGAVQPLHVHAPADQRALDHVSALTRVPLWVPRPLLFGWVISGVAYAGDERGGARATVLNCSGPVTGGRAGRPGPGRRGARGGAGGKAGRPDRPGAGASVRSRRDEGARRAPPDRAVGHRRFRRPRHLHRGSAGIWLWVVVRPASAYVLLIDNLKLHDLRDGIFASLDLVFGAASPMLTDLQGRCRDER